MRNHIRGLWVGTALAGLLGRAGAGAGGDDQGRGPALAVGHDGDLGDDAEGRHADADRGAERQGRRPRQAAGGRRRRSGVRLAALRRALARADRRAGGRRGVRLLDQRQPQVGAAGVRGAELGAVLPGAVRGAGEPAQRLLHRRGAEPAGDPGGRLPDERGGGRALGARRHRLRLSADDEPDPRGLPEGERRRRRGHHDQLHAVRAFRLADDRLRRQGLRLAGQEDRGGVDDQRRRQRAVLQGARQPGHLGRGHPRRRLLGRRGGARRASTPRRWSATWRPGTTSRASTRPRTPSSSRSGRRSPATRSAPPTTRWRRTTSASTCG